VRLAVLSMTDPATYRHCPRAFALFPLQGNGRARCLPWQEWGSADVHRLLARVFMALVRGVRLGAVPEAWRAWEAADSAEADALRVEEPVHVQAGPMVGLCGIPDLWWIAGETVFLAEWKKGQWPYTGFQLDFYAALLAEATGKQKVVAVEVDVDEPGAYRVYGKDDLARLWRQFASIVAEIVDKTMRLWSGGDLETLFPFRVGCRCGYGLDSGALFLPAFRTGREVPKGMEFGPSKPKPSRLAPKAEADDLPVFSIWRIFGPPPACSGDD